MPAIPDPNEKATFNPVPNRRAGYQSSTSFFRVLKAAKAGHSLAAGEGQLLLLTLEEAMLADEEEQAITCSYLRALLAPASEGTR